MQHSAGETLVIFLKCILVGCHMRCWTSLFTRFVKVGGINSNQTSLNESSIFMRLFLQCRWQQSISRHCVLDQPLKQILHGSIHCPLLWSEREARTTPIWRVLSDSMLMCWELWHFYHVTFRPTDPRLWIFLLPLPFSMLIGTFPPLPSHSHSLIPLIPIPWSPTHCCCLYPSCLRGGGSSRAAPALLQGSQAQPGIVAQWQWAGSSSPCLLQGWQGTPGVLKGMCVH